TTRRHLRSAGSPQVRSHHWGCSGQPSLPEDSVEVELDLWPRKGSMDGNVSRPANGGANPAPFTEAAMAGYGASSSLWRPRRRSPYRTHSRRSASTLGTAPRGRVAVWRGGGRPNIAVAVP